MLGILKEKKEVNNNLIEIVSDYEILHYDEMPILYVGKNKFNDIIIGSSLFEDYNTNKMFCLHSIISNEIFNDFINGKISYLDVLKNSKSINVIKEDFNGKNLKVFDINFNDIPDNYLPSKDSYYIKEKNIKDENNLKNK